MESSVSNVQFSERTRGFDRDEVMNYLRQIDAKIADLREVATAAVERAEAAELRARQAASGSSASGANDADRATGVLAMAQRTAEETVVAARAEAEALREETERDAEARRLAAEAQAQQIVADVRQEMEASRTEHLAAMRQEIDELSAVRAAITDDVDKLRAHRQAQLDDVGRIAGVLAALAHDTGAPGPELSGAVPAFGAADDTVLAGTAQEVGVGVIDTGDDVEVVTYVEGEDGDWQEGDADPGATAAVPMEFFTSGGDDDALAGLTGEPDPFAAETAMPVADEPGADAGAWGPEAAPQGGGYGYDAGGVPEPVFAEPVFADPGDADPAAPVDADADSALGPVDEEADEAMRAFFETDISEGDDDGGSRWGFRRR